MPKPIIDPEKCNHCKICIEVCPIEVFANEEGKVIVKKPEDCIDCKACEAQCPQQAIKIIE